MLFAYQYLCIFQLSSKNVQHRNVCCRFVATIHRFDCTGCCAPVFYQTASSAGPCSHPGLLTPPGPSVYMSCMSQNFRLFHVSNLSVRNFRIFLLMYPGSVSVSGAVSLSCRPVSPPSRPVFAGDSPPICSALVSTYLWLPSATRLAPPPLLLADAQLDSSATRRRQSAVLRLGCSEIAVMSRRCRGGGGRCSVGSSFGAVGTRRH